MAPVIDSLTQCGGDKVKCRTQPLKVFASNGFPGWDVGDLSPIAAGLQKQGYTVRYLQVQEGHAWTAWRGLADEMLTFMESPSK